MKRDVRKWMLVPAFILGFALVWIAPASVYAQGGGLPDVVGACLGSECPTGADYTTYYSSSAACFNAVGWRAWKGDEAFGTVVGGDFTVAYDTAWDTNSQRGAAESEGRTLVFGNATNLKNFQNSQGLTTPGQLNQYTVGDAGGGSCVGTPAGFQDLVYGGTLSGPGTWTTNQGTSNDTSPFSTLLSDIASASSCYAALTPGHYQGGVRVGDTATACSSSASCAPGVYVFNDTADINLNDIPDDGTVAVIINVTGAGPVTLSGASVSGTRHTDILYNVVSATDVTVGSPGSTVKGSILIANPASTTTVYATSGADGRFMSLGDVNHSGPGGAEFHNVPFRGNELLKTEIVCSAAATGSITIIKDALPNSGEDFSFTATGATPASFSLDDDNDGALPNQQLFSGLLDGSYTFAEATTAGWDLTNISCSGNANSTVTVGASGGFEAGDRDVTIDLVDAENVTCTFTNTEQQVSTPAIALSKKLNTPAPVTAGSSVSFTIRITNTGSSAIASLALTDTYDTTYLTYNAVEDGLGPNPASEPNDDGSISWANVIQFDNNGQLDPNESMELLVTFVAKSESAGAAAVECASQGHSFNKATALSQESCVEFAIEPTPSKSTLGDFVWADLNADGVKDAGEQGIDGVRVELYEIIDLGGGITETQFITFQLTGPDRTGIDADDTPTYGDAGAYDFQVQDDKVYQVIITSTNFLPGGALEDYIYTGNNAANIYNGPNPRVVSIGTQVDENNADFAFWRPSVSIGNQVWQDGNDNGLYEGTEDVIPGLLMELWIDVDGDGVAEPLGDDGAAALMSTTTSASGQYSFTNLLPGDYFVRIPAPPPTSPLSSIPLSAPDNGVDNDDNGDQPGGPSTQILSPVVTLTVGEEPGTVGGGNYDFTIDFGLVDPFLGNLVWHDQNNNGLVDPAEPGIPGVTVTVLYDANGNGAIDANELIPYRETQTDANGIYAFGDLFTNSNYQVVIPVQNFQPGGALENLPYSSSSTQIADNQVDEDDNGIQSSPSMTVTSPIINLTVDAEPIDGNGANDESGRGSDLDNTDDNNGDMTVDFGFYQQQAVPQLAVSKSLNGINPFGVGATISFTIRITNTGNITLTTLPLEDRYSSAFFDYQSVVPAAPAPTAAGGILTWSDLLANDPNGLGINESISVNVYFTTMADTTLLSAMSNCSPAGQAPNLARVSNALAGGTPVVTDADDAACASVQILNPTGIQLAERTITQTPAGVLVRWQMVDESNVTGFYVWKANGVDSSRRSELIPTGVNGQTASAAAYEWLDAGATLTRGDAYILEIVKVNDSSERVVIDVVRGISLYLPLLAR